MQTDLRTIIAELKKPFPVESHKERELPGKGRWFFIPWQIIRERLDDVYPEWQVSYSEAKYLGDYCHITCTITIANISRSAPGNAPIQLLSSSGKDYSRGTPIERAIADSFKNASEAWGVARYLDDQTFVVNYMQSKNDGRAYKFATESAQIEAGVRGQKKTIQPKAENQTREITTSDPSSNNTRILEIRDLLGISRQTTMKWLSSQGKKTPADCSVEECDRLVQWLCLSFAMGQGMNEFHARNSYTKRVLGAIMDGQEEIIAIQFWVEYIKNFDKSEVQNG